MAYTGTNIKDLDTSKPDGAAEYGSILDDSDKEIKTVLKNQYAITTITTDTTLSAVHSTIHFNKATAIAATLPAASTIASSTYRKDYYFLNINAGTATITGTVTIEGTATVNPTLAQNESMHVWTDGTTYYGEKGTLEGGFIGMQVLTSGTTYTPTAGTSSIVVELVGAGGAGSAGSTPTAGNASCGGGGGGGGYARKRFTGISGTYTYAIGAGGSGAGGDTTFTGPGSVTVTAKGGSVGSASGLTSDSSNIIGVGGAGGTVSTNGDINLGGESGGWGIASFLDGQFIIGGKGGNSKFGASGVPAYRIAGGFTSAVAGTGYGAGGTGGVTYAGTGSAAGNGRSGVIVVWEFN